MLRPWPRTGECGSSSRTRTRGSGSRSFSRTASARSAPTSRNSSPAGTSPSRATTRTSSSTPTRRRRPSRRTRSILAELDHHGLAASTSAVEHWLADEERWDNEPPVEGWEEEVADKGYAPWEVRVTCHSRHDAIRLEQQLEEEGYRPIRQWKHLIVGTDTREEAEALAERVHGEVEAGGAVVWEEAIDSNLVRPFAFFG